MPEITDATVLRRTLRFTEGEYPEFTASLRTTIVVVRAVFESVPGIDGWDFWVYGFRKERPYIRPGGEEDWSRHYTSRYQGGGEDARRSAPDVSHGPEIEGTRTYPPWTAHQDAPWWASPDPCNRTRHSRPDSRSTRFLQERTIPRPRLRAGRFHALSL